MKTRSEVHSSRFRVFSLLFALCFQLVLWSPVLAEERLELTLKQAVEIALKENLQLQGERLSTNVSESDILVKEGEFDPSFKLQAVESFQKGITDPSQRVFLGDEQRIFSADAGIGGKAHPGTTYELKWTNSRFRSNSSFFQANALIENPLYTSELILKVSQPVLKGFGRAVQDSNLNVAKNAFEMAKLKFEDRGLQVVTETTKAYWDLLSARDDLDAAELALKLAKNLHDEVKARIDAGLLAEVDIYKAEAEVSLREETVLRIKKLISDAEDNLRTKMNVQDWRRELVPVEKLSGPFMVPDLDPVVEAAMQNRRDLRQALLDKKTKEILKKYHENQLLPDLSLTGAAGLNGSNGSYGDTVDKLDSGKYYSWQFGLALTIPIGNRTAKGNALKARFEEEKAETDLQALRQRVTSEVREAWRALALAQQSIEATQKTRIASQKRLDAEEGRFKVGMATINDVLKFQEDFARSLASERRAKTAYAKSFVELERAKGTLTDSNLMP